MNEKKVQSRKRNQNQTQKKSRDRQAQPRNTFGNQHRSQFQAAFQIFCRRWLPVCIAALILSGTANLLRESRLQQEVAAKIVRFHVRANSDCASDQQIKLQVRDAVAEELQTILHGAETKAETEEILRENEPSIRAAALQTLRAGGSTDDIIVTYGKASFEEKETGSYILPAGTYDALQINIGRAKGHNWWCMLYPSICFSDALRPVNEDGGSAEKVEKSRIPLQNLLSDAAYREILKSDRISFRFFWHASKRLPGIPSLRRIRKRLLRCIGHASDGCQEQMLVKRDGRNLRYFPGDAARAP